MTFPEWVPEELCCYWQKQYSGKKHISHLRQELLRRLLTDDCMKWVWSEIGKRRRLPPDGMPDEMFYPEFLLQVNKALFAYQRERKTRTETAKQYVRIAEAGRELAEAVKGSRLDSTPYRWYPDDIIGNLLSRMPPELAENTFCLINPLPGTSKEHVWLGAHTLSRSDGRYALSGLLPFGTSSADFFECLLGGHRHPTLSAIAEALAKEADTRAKEAKTELRVLSKVRSSNTEKYDPRRVAFIRSMARFFVQQCGSPLYGTLATLSAVALEDDTITKETVESALEGWEIPDDNRENFPL